MALRERTLAAWQAQELQVAECSVPRSAWRYNTRTELLPRALPALARAPRKTQGKHKAAKRTSSLSSCCTPSLSDTGMGGTSIEGDGRVCTGNHCS